MKVNGKRATVAIVPRERFSHTEKTIRSVLENTQIPYDLIFVDGKTPEPILTRVLKNLEPENPTIIKSDSYLSPNEARNLAANAAKTEFLVFLDNDTLGRAKVVRGIDSLRGRNGCGPGRPTSIHRQFPTTNDTHRWGIPT
jgi:hypothetical protein